MQKHIVLYAIAFFMLFMLASAVKGSIANAERAEIIRECMNDVNCYYDPNN